MLQFPTYSPYATIVSYSLHATMSSNDDMSFLVFFGRCMLYFFDQDNKIDLALFLTASFQNYLVGILAVGVFFGCVCYAGHFSKRLS